MRKCCSFGREIPLEEFDVSLTFPLVPFSKPWGAREERENPKYSARRCNKQGDVAHGLS